MSGPAGIDARIEAFGYPIRLKVAVQDRLAGLADFVPLARQIADQIASAARRRAAAAGHPATCREGCAACCRHPVPVSAPEAGRLGQEIQALPAQERAIVERRFRAAAGVILESDILEKTRGDGGLDRISEWYWALKLDCPLLENDRCRLYDRRPLACREHLVTSPPAGCGQVNGPSVSLTPPVSVAECLPELACRFDPASAASLCGKSPFL